MKESSNANIRYTTVLPLNQVEELKELAEQKVISSVNYGIREAVAHYLVETKRELYALRMAEAAQDPEYINRTLDSQSAFSDVDGEVGGQW